MEFEEVHHYLLEADQKYKIVYKNRTYKATFYDYSTHGINVAANFINRNYYSFIIDNYLHFYQPIFLKKEIQQDMEQRSLTLILQSILGDPYFQW